MLFIIIAIVAGISILYFVFKLIVEKGDEKYQAEFAAKLDNALAKYPDFVPDERYEGVCREFLLAFDKKNENVLYIDTKTWESIVFPFSDIVDVELSRADGSTTSYRSDGRTIGGALVGGAIGGAAGAVVGGLSGDVNHSSAVRIVVRILLRNQPISSLVVVCFNGYTSGLGYGKGVSLAEQINDTITVILDGMKKDAPQNASMADEIEKLFNLKERGILSEEEFQSKKQQLLSQ